MNRIRIVCRDADRRALKVMSTFAASETLEARTDETLDFGDTDLVVVRNQSESPCTVTMRDFEVHGGTAIGAILQPSRQRTYVVRKGDREGARLTLGAGESMTIRTTGWRPPIGRGQQGVVG